MLFAVGFQVKKKKNLFQSIALDWHVSTVLCTVVVDPLISWVL